MRSGRPGPGWRGPRHPPQEPRQHRLRAVRVVPAAVDGEAVDDEDVQGEDRQGPERIRLDPRQLDDRVDRRDRDGEPPGQLATVHQRQRRQSLGDAEGEHDPAPRAQVAEDVLRVADEEIRLGERDDAVDDVERSRAAEHDGREEAPCGTRGAARAEARDRPALARLWVGSVFEGHPASPPSSHDQRRRALRSVTQLVPTARATNRITAPTSPHAAQTNPKIRNTSTAPSPQASAIASSATQNFAPRLRASTLSGFVDLMGPCSPAGQPRVSPERDDGANPAPRTPRRARPRARTAARGTRAAAGARASPSASARRRRRATAPGAPARTCSAGWPPRPAARPSRRPT